MPPTTRPCSPPPPLVPAWLAAAAWVLIGSPAWGDEIVTGPSMAVGGATRATARDNSVIDTNASAMSAISRYTVETGFQYYGLLSSKRVTGSAMDSRTSTFALGVAYSFDWWEPPFDPALDLAWYATGADPPEDKRRTHRIVIGAAQGLLNRRINVGVAARILSYEHDIRADVKKFTLDVSGTFVVAPNVSLFVVANNLVPTGLASDPITLVSGLGLVLGPLRVEAEAVVDFTSDPEAVRADLQAGLELRLLQQISLAGGFASDRGFTDTYVTWGVGWFLPKFGIQYAMRIEAGEMDHRTRPEVEPGWDRVLHSIALQVTP